MTHAYQKIRAHANEIQEKMEGGNDANIEDHPYFVRLIIRAENNSIACGGCYIRPRWVLTASHCLDINDYDNQKTPNVGEDKTRAKCLGGLKDSQKSGYQAISSINLFMNPNYFRNETEVLNDIGLIQLQYQFKMKSTVKLIAMPKSKIDYSGKSVLIMGWGNAGVDEKASEGNETEPRKLQTLKTTVHDMKTCTERIGSPSAICLGKKGEVACSGDSGGPLIFEKLIIGICSFGFGCSGELAVYENVYTHRDWINEVAGKPSCTRCKAANRVVDSFNYFFISCFLTLHLYCTVHR